MKDSFFYKSLFSTIFIFIILAGILITFIIITGFVGFMLIVMNVVLLLIYFYGGFEKITFLWRYKQKNE